MTLRKLQHVMAMLAALQADPGCTQDASSLRDQKETILPLETVVVTATAVPQSKMHSSVSVSTLDPEQIMRSAPASAADILRNIPGLHSEVSGGEGNAKISVRGLPSPGGAKFVQFQEDGLPVLDFGDIEFGTADTFIKADYNLDRLEVLRGGSASTFASHAPGGIFNFISKTGDVAGGNIAISKGLDVDQTRYDFDYGRPIDARWRFHFGGFFREGEGACTAGYTAERGGQIKANLTRTFDAGYLRLHLKLLDDRAPVYLPVPITISGANADPHIASIPGFDVLNGAMQSQYFRTDLSVNRDGKPVLTDIADGYATHSRAFGAEAAFKLADGWRFDEKFRVASTAGRFVGPYPAQVDTASALAASIGGAGATRRYASGPLAGQAVGDPALLAGNGLALRTHLFNTTLNDFGNFANDFKLAKRFDHPDFGATSVTLGYFKSHQKIDMDWHWNTYLQEVRGRDAALLDVLDASGKLVTQGGLAAYGEPLWGNCCVRSYRLAYDTDAPYLALHWQRDALDLDGSLRYDIFHAGGSYAGASGTVPLDVNGNGVIEGPEQAVPLVDQSRALPVDYTKRYRSYSFGANYRLDPNWALFARTSQGGRGNATRLLFGGGVNPDGSVADKVAINMVRQLEGGVKWRNRHFSVFATTEDTNQDITSGAAGSGKVRFISRVYQADGLKLEAAWHSGRLTLDGGLTYTRARVSKDEILPSNLNHVPQRQARYAYQLTPAYNGERATFGLNLIGTTASYAAPGNGLIMPRYIQVNAFVSYLLAKGVSFSVVGNNLFNRIGITEVQQSPAAVAANGLNTARSIDGRTLKAALQYAF